MENVTATVVLAKELGPSSSGKTDDLAFAEGNAAIPCREEVKVEPNACTGGDR